MTPDLAISPVALETYLAHVADGTGQRELARARGVNPSTVCRAVARCEELRDSAEWDELLSILQTARLATGRTTGLPLLPRNAGAAEILGVLTAGSDPLADLRPVTAALAGGAHVVTGRGLPVAIVVAAGDVRVGAMPRRAVLAAILLGWFRPARLGEKLSRYALTQRGADALAAAGAAPATLPAALSDAAGVARTTDDLATAHWFAGAWSAAGADAGLAHLRAAMPGWLFQALAGVCGEGRRIGEVERALDMPPRAGRGVIAAALSMATALRAQVAA